MMITQAFDLNLIPGGVKPIVKASQYDASSRTLAISLFNGVTAFTIPSGAQVLIQGTKKDGTGFQYECTFSGNVVTAEVAQQMTVFAGPVEVELQILSGGEVLGTGNFILQVEQAALADDTVISETDIPIIQRIPEYVAEAQGAAEEASLWNDNGGDSGQSTPGPTNNAYYWAQQAHQAAGGGVTSFKGRTGVVVPAAGDYNAEQVSYGQSSNVKQEIDTLKSDLTELDEDVNGTYKNSSKTIASLDSMTNTGRYYISISETSDIFINGGTYFMEVFRTLFGGASLGVVQRISIVYPPRGQTWQRSYYVAGGWSGWKELSN